MSVNRLNPYRAARVSKWFLSVGTPGILPSPTITTTPTPIQEGGIRMRCAPSARPTIRTANPVMYKPNDMLRAVARDGPFPTPFILIACS